MNISLGIKDYLIKYKEIKAKPRVLLWKHFSFLQILIVSYCSEWLFCFLVIKKKKLKFIFLYCGKIYTIVFAILMILSIQFCGIMYTHTFVLWLLLLSFPSSLSEVIMAGRNHKKHLFQLSHFRAEETRRTVGLSKVIEQVSAGGLAQCISM